MWPDLTRFFMRLYVGIYARRAEWPPLMRLSRAITQAFTQGRNFRTNVPVSLFGTRAKRLFCRAAARGRSAGPAAAYENLLGCSPTYCSPT